MKKSFFILATILLTVTGWSHTYREKNAKDKPAETFSDAEANFKIVLQKLLDRYIDKSLNKEDLYRAATQGMLNSLNPEGADETWNELLSPSDLKEVHMDLSGKITGVGMIMEFEEKTGNGLVLGLVPGSSAEKAGIKAEDQVLSVDGKKFKGKKIQDIVYAVRGVAGKSVSLKILRDDKVLTLNIKREIVSWTPVDLENINNSIAVLSIGFFNEETPQIVEQKINEINKHKYDKLIIDVRGNSGGGFDQAIKVTELFLPKDMVVASTKDRQGKVEQFKSTKGLLNSNVQIIILTDKTTFCGAELFVAALKENLRVKVVGETTFGKWNAQSIEILPNKYAVKYTIKDFQSPQGNSYRGVGIKPDIEVVLSEKIPVHQLKSKYDIRKRIDYDAQLKAAVELLK